jgi:hypothetical protein
MDIAAGSRAYYLDATPVDHVDELVHAECLPLPSFVWR